MCYYLAQKEEAKVTRWKDIWKSIENAVGSARLVGTLIARYVREKHIQVQEKQRWWFAWAMICRQYVLVE